jgi:adenylate cyclase
MELFDQAISEDPNFAPARASVAKLYIVMSAHGILPPSVVHERTRSEALQALRLCPDLAEAHTAMGWLQLLYDADWPAAERSFQRSININPSATHAYEGYCHLLTATGRHEEAVKVAKQACELDPLSPFAANVLTCTLYFARRFEEAVAQALRSIETEPGFPIAHSSLGWCYEAMGRMDEAVACHRVSVVQNSGSPAMLANLAHTLALAGQTQEARSVLEQILSVRHSAYVPAYWIALVYSGLGEHTKALDWLEIGVVEHCGWRVFYGVDPKLDVLASDARFRRLLEAVSSDSGGREETNSGAKAAVI